MKEQTNNDTYYYYDYEGMGLRLHGDETFLKNASGEYAAPDTSEAKHLVSDIMRFGRIITKEEYETEPK